MGRFEFQVAHPEHLPEFAQETAHVVGIDRVPWRGTTYWEGDPGNSRRRLVHERASDESGAFTIPWICSDGTWTALATTFLREASGPFSLERELARGTLYRSRQTAYLLDQHTDGVAPHIQAQLDEAIAQFVTHLANGDSHSAVGVIELAYRVQNDLAAELSKHPEVLCRREPSRGEMWRVGQVHEPFASSSSEAAFLNCFDTLAVDVRWSEVEPEDGRFEWERLDHWLEWGRRHQLRTVLTNLIRLDASHIPDWIGRLDAQADSIYQYAVRFLQSVIDRYGDVVAAWECAAGLNLPGILSLGMEQRLKLAIVALDTIHRRLPHRPLLVAFDQPWGESMVHYDSEMSAFHFADMLVRADLGIRGISLDFSWGYWPAGSLIHGGLQLHWVLRQWGLFKLPIMVRWGIPHGPADPSQRSNSPILHPDGCTPPDRNWQADQLRRLLPLCLCHDVVHGAMWNAWHDDDAPRTPVAGMWEAGSESQPTVEAWQAVFAQID